jgi:enoyl-CoA hydratase
MPRPESEPEEGSLALVFRGFKFPTRPSTRDGPLAVAQGQSLGEEPRPEFESGVSSLPRTRFTAKLPRRIRLLRATVFRGFDLVVGGGACALGRWLVCADQRLEAFERLLGQYRLCGREAIVTVREVDRELPQRDGRATTGRRRPCHDGEFEYVGLEVAVERRVVSLTANRLVAPERTDNTDGGVGGLGPGQQVEPARDEDVRDEHVDVSCAGSGRLPVDSLAGGRSLGGDGCGFPVGELLAAPGLLVDERPGQAQPLVDELDTGSTLGDAVLCDGIVGCAGTENGQDTGCDRPAVDALADSLDQSVGFDVVDGVSCRLPDRSGFLHWPRLAAARAKTFGNDLPRSAMITTATDGSVTVVTLDRPGRRNALTPDGLDALETAIAEIDAPVVLLRGAGEAFCAGADLDVVADLDGDTAREFARRGQAVARAIETTESVVVAGIDGAARGGGVEFALACDVRVATDRATFAETGVTLGLFGAWGGTVRLPAVVGMGEAMDIALSGRVVDAEDALRMGLISRIVSDPRAVANEIAENDHEALGVLKTRMRDGGPVDEQEASEVDAFARLVDRLDLER